MKRFLIQIAFLLTVPLMVLAGPVTPSRAEMVAKQYLKAETGRAVSVRRVAEPVYLTKSAPAEPAYYIFEAQGGGFAIIAGDDRLSPVIGWSDKGGFDAAAMPAHVRSWLDMWRDVVEAIRAGRLQTSSGVASEWETIELGRTPAYAAGKTLDTAEWGQEPPFNNFCPNNSAAGCVAVAAAIMLRYHEWPPKGQGELPGYTYVDDAGVTQQEAAIPLGREYAWDNMPLKFDDSTPIEAQDEVAKLIHEMGVMVQSNYNEGGTGAYTQDVYGGLIEHYFYDAGAFHYYKSYYTDNEWHQMLTDNIDKVGPVLYSGYGESGGHAFVLDGYNAQGQFRINFGWSGRYNGYYSIPAFDEFTDGHQATLNLRKDAGGSFVDGLYIDGNGKEVGLSCDTTYFEVGSIFNVTCKYLFNVSTHIFDGEVALAVRHRDGTIGEIVEIDTLQIWPNNGFGFIYEECWLEEDILIGDRLCMWYRSENTPEWTPIAANVEEGNVAEIPIADPYSIAEVTSFRYTSSSGELTISTKADAEWEIADGGGTTYTDGVKFEEGVLTVDTRKFVKDSYFITLRKSYDSKTVEFVFGKKEAEDEN